MTQFVPPRKHQDIVIHRIQFLKITNYILCAVGHQISLLLEVCHLIWLIYPSQCNNQSIYLSVMVAAIET